MICIHRGSGSFSAHHTPSCRSHVAAQTSIASDKWVIWAVNNLQHKEAATLCEAGRADECWDESLESEASARTKSASARFGLSAACPAGHTLL